MSINSNPLVSPGLDGKFFWFTGVVENVDDPRRMGRVQVRIFGKDTENLSFLPTNDLFWSPTLRPTTATHASIDIKPGDWVMGFFRDGDCGLQSCILGTWAGINSGDYDSSKGFSPQLTSEQKEEEPAAEEGIIVAGNKQNSISGSSQLTRGKLEGTIVNVTNKQLAHVCDISLQVKNSAYYERFKRSQIMQAIRSLITSLSQLFGTLPDEYTTKFIVELKRLTAWLKEVQKNIKIIQDFLTFVTNFANLLGQMIKWIQSLPQKLLSFLSECITKFTKAVGNIVSDLLSVPGTSGNQYKEVLDTLKETTQTLEQTAKSATTLVTTTIGLPVAISGAITNPSSVDINNTTTISTITTQTASFVSELSNTATSGVVQTVDTVVTNIFNPDNFSLG